jgi:cation diffusion facilitator CzcD-associated flavoprotein CzcO
MTVTSKEAAGGSAAEGGYVDVVIVGAGISGLGAAYRITERNPHLTYTIL